MHRSKLSIMISRATLCVASTTSVLAVHAYADCASPHEEWQLDWEKSELSFATMSVTEGLVTLTYERPDGSRYLAKYRVVAKKE